MVTPCKVGPRKNFPMPVDGVNNRRVPYLMEAELFNSAREMAAREGCSISRIINTLVRRGLKRNQE